MLQKLHLAGAGLDAASARAAHDQIWLASRSAGSLPFNTRCRLAARLMMRAWCCVSDLTHEPSLDMGWPVRAASNAARLHALSAAARGICTAAHAEAFRLFAPQAPSCA